MTVLPVPGADVDDWGDKLNAWLLASRNADGTLKSSAVQSAIGGSVSSTGDVVLSADTGGSGTGDIILKTDGAVERLRLKNGGGFLATPGTNARVVAGSGFSWSAGRAFSYVNKDGLFYIDGFTDASGAVNPTYTKMFGGNATKTGHGNFDAHWASIAHQGDGQAGLFIGDVTSSAGGDAWGADFVLIVNTAAANMVGQRILLTPNVTLTGKTAFGLEIGNSVDANAATQALRIFGNFANPIIVYSDAAATQQIFVLDLSGNLNIKGALNPTTSGNSDLGAIGTRWRSLYANNLLVNGADAASGSAVLAMHNAAVTPSGSPTSGGVLYIEAGALKYLGSGGTVTVLAVA